jgi:hypothetical protein
MFTLEANARSGDFHRYWGLDVLILKYKGNDTKINFVRIYLENNHLKKVIFHMKPIVSKIPL